MLLDCVSSPLTGSSLMLGKQNLGATFLSAPPMLSLFSCTPTLISFLFNFFFQKPCWHSLCTERWSQRAEAGNLGGIACSGSWVKANKSVLGHLQLVGCWSWSNPANSWMSISFLLVYLPESQKHRIFRAGKDLWDDGVQPSSQHHHYVHY